MSASVEPAETRRMRSLLRPAWMVGGARGGERDVRVPAPDQRDAAQQIALIVRIRSRVPRADVLAAVRHALRLPVGADSVPLGALHLERADDASVTIGSVGRHGSCFSSVLELRDAAAGCSGVYRVRSWHTRRGRICGVEQVCAVRELLKSAVREADPSAEIEESRPRTDMSQNGTRILPTGTQE